MDGSSLSSFIIWTVLLLIFGAVIYGYFAVTLMMIARKTNTPGVGLAWIPLANLVLMCRIARRPGWWVLLFLIPFVGLVVFVMLWMSIAEVCGKSAWVGVLIIIPVVGLIVPAYLAMGKAEVPNFVVGARDCQACGTPIVSNETFCRNCGEAAATIVAAKNQTAQPRTSSGQMVLVGGVAAIGVFLIAGIVGWLALTSIFAYAAPERQPSAISDRTEGTLTEFPVDTEKDEDEILVPDVVSTEDLQNPTGNDLTKNEKQTKKRLPPGLDRNELKKRKGETLTTTVYRPRKKEPEPTDDNDIYISVVQIPTGNGDQIAVDIAKQTKGERTGAKVKSPRGGNYVGSKIRSPQILVYVLEKQGSNILIIIYTPNPSMQDDAARLAGNVGNGDGLNDYPETRTTLWTLPQEPPSDLVLVDFKTTTRDEMGLSPSDLDSAEADEETRKLIDYFSQFIPERATEARYRDSARKDWKVGIYDYESSGKAWRTWLFLSWTIGMSGKSTPLKHGDGIFIENDGESVLIFQKGPYLIFIQPPAGANTDKLVSFGNSFQV